MAKSKQQDTSEPIGGGDQIADAGEYFIQPDTEFWNKLGSEFDEGLRLIADSHKNADQGLVLAAGIIESFSKDDFRTVCIGVTKDAAQLAPPKSTFVKWRRYLWRRKYWAILPIVIVVLAASVILRIRATLDNEIIVRKPGGIKIYSKIAAEDLENNAAATTATGRYTLSNIPHNDFLDEKDLLSKNLSDDMKGRVILSIPVRNDILNVLVKPNSKADILFTDGQNPARTTTVKDLIILNVEKRENVSVLTVGIAPDQFSTLSLLPSRDAVLVTSTGQ